MPADDAARTPPQQEERSSSRDPLAPSAEECEREAAWRRGAEVDRTRAAREATEPETTDNRPQRNAEARAFTALAENVRDYAIFLMDPRGVITFWGEGARLIKWWTKSEAEGAHLRMLYMPGGSDDGTAEEHLEHAAERGEYTGEGQRVRSDGSTFWAGVTLTALWDDDGTLLGYAKVTRDLTARRAGEALLKSAAVAAEQARSAAELASRAKSEFLATMSHEIRTPVNAILGYLDLLSHEIGGPLTESQQDYTARARRGCRHLIALIGDVLDFSRLEAGRLAVVRKALRIGDVVGQALGLVMPLAEARGLFIDDSVSGMAEELAIWGDEARVRQILVNLLANAVKFTERRGDDPGQITVSVGTAMRPSPDAEVVGEGPWVYVRVEDTGPGIAEDRLVAVFEPFVQADMTLTREHGGTGLGLAISRRLARAMGGDVTARSQPGVGSAFFLWLPSAPVESLHVSDTNKGAVPD